MVATTGITTTAVANNLGVSSHAVGYLCSNNHGKTNPFAKYKPVRLDSLKGRSDPGSFLIDDTRIPIMYSTDWWRSRNGLCGFNIPNSDILWNPNVEESVWEYLPPQGGANDPFRLGDFGGYEPNASSNLFTFSMPSKVFLNKGFSCTLNIPKTNASGNGLTLHDIYDPNILEQADNIRICISFRANSNPNGTYHEVQIPLGTESNIIRLTDDDVRLGGTVGGKLWAHVYMRDHLGRIKSLRNVAGTKTVFEAQYVSNEEFKTQLRCQVVLRHLNTKPYYLDVRTLSAIVNAQLYAGGNLPATTLMMYKYVNDSTDYVHETELWSKNFDAVTVQAGDYYYMPGIPDQFEVWTGGYDSQAGEKVIFIWYKYQTQELARLVLTVNRMND